ncbi:hypothetical protein [Streptomyces sp. NPDC057580]|uniref:hypothetical protein n=1 Tax=Streptomyces sp. NPDC057580 TaxID=3346173 RepID=UPI0036AFC908
MSQAASEATSSPPSPRVEPRHQELRLEHLTRLVTGPVPYGDGLLPLKVSLGAATRAGVGSTDLPTLMRAADTVMYEGKYTSTVIQAGPEHTSMPSINGRRAGRPGTSTPHPVA